MGYRFGEEESCSTATVAAPFRVIIGYPILEKIYYNGVNFLLISPTPGHAVKKYEI